MDHRGAEPQEGGDGAEEDPPGAPGRARHGADHGGGDRQQGVLPALDGALFYPEQAAVDSTAGSPPTTSGTRKGPAALLKEAGYAGQPVRWITTREYEWMYKTAVVAKQQIEKPGFVVDLQVQNYTLSPLTLIADITKLPLSVSGITAENKPYDGST